MLKCYRLLILLSLVVFLIQGCDSGSRYSSFNPKEVTFSEVKVEVAKNDQAKKAELEKLIVQAKVDTIKPEDVMRYQLANALNKSLEVQKSELNKLTLELDKLKSNDTAKLFTPIESTEIHMGGGIWQYMGKEHIHLVNTDNKVYTFDKNNFNLLNSKIKANESIRGVFESKDKLLVGGFFGLEVYDKQTFKYVKTLFRKEAIYNSVSVGDKLVVGNYQKVNVLDKKTFKVLHSFSSGYFVKFTANENYLALIDTFKDRLMIYDMKNYKMLYDLSVDFSKGKEEIAMEIVNNKIIISYKNKELCLIDFVNKKVLHSFQNNIVPYKLRVIGNSVLYKSNSDELSLFNTETLETNVVFKTEENIGDFNADNEALYMILWGKKTVMQKYNFKAIIENSTAINELISQQVSLESNIKAFENKIKEINTLLVLKDNATFLTMANIMMKKTYKNGVIGERYVPYTSTSYSSPQHSTTYINGRAYNETKYEDKSYSNGGYNTEVHGYKAIYRVDNNSRNYYYVKLKFDWSGKYSKYEVYNKGGAWSGESGTGSKLVSNTTYSTHEEEFVIAPEDNYKFQFEVGEEKSSIDLENIDIKIIPEEYYEALNYALDVKNEDIELLTKFLNDSKLINWKNKIKGAYKEITHEINKRFNEANIKNAEVNLTINEKTYDKDFESKVTLTASSSKPMCVYINTPFGDKMIKTQEGKETGFLFWKRYEKSIDYIIRGVSKESLKASVKHVAKICD
ncbi:MAG: hypothetical protein ACNI3C_10075 [Candidatus Marinarcus sp.]|uniref:hypothetical protein n=1 Tax=Candidatus Marinarcus sp. TaxID=3100987 RepID=UPI003B007E10